MAKTVRDGGEAAIRKRANAQHFEDERDARESNKANGDDDTLPKERPPKSLTDQVYEGTFAAHITFPTDDELRRILARQKGPPPQHLIEMLPAKAREGGLQVLPSAWAAMTPLPREEQTRHLQAWLPHYLQAWRTVLRHAASGASVILSDALGDILTVEEKYALQRAQDAIRSRRAILDGNPDDERPHRQEGIGRGYSVSSDEMPRILKHGKRSKIIRKVAEWCTDDLGVALTADQIDKIWRRRSGQLSRIRDATDAAAQIRAAAEVLLSRESSEAHLCRDILTEPLVDKVIAKRAQREDEVLILAVLYDAGRPLTACEVSGRAGIAEATVADLLERLEAEGEVRHVDCGGRRGSYYVTPDSPDGRWTEGAPNQIN